MDMTLVLQNALGARHVPLLSELHARPVYGHDGKPLVVAGNNAVVGRVRRADDSNIAIRLSLDPAASRPSLIRHAALGAHLASSPNSRLPGALRIVNDALSIFPEPGREEMLSVVTMEWIEGPTLLQAVDRAARGAKTGVLRALAAGLVGAVNDLHDGDLVHGDLSATNAMVRANGTVCFVDLDTLGWVGAPIGSTSSAAPSLRHPSGTFGGKAGDRFALLVLYASLVLLGEDPDLRRSFGDPTGSLDGAILFSAWDLADPGTSRAFMEVRSRVSAERRTLLDALAAACTGDERALDAALRVVPGIRIEAPAATTPGDAPGWSLDSALDRIRARYTSPAAPPASTWTVPTGADDDPEQTVATVAVIDASASTWPVLPLDPEERSALTKIATADDLIQLERAIARNDDGEVARIWAMVGDDPVVQLRTAEVEDVLAAAVCRRIESEARAGRDRSVLQLANEAAMRRLPLTHGARLAARSAVERVAVRAELDQALAANDRQALTNLAVSGQLVVLGDADDESLRTVLRAIEYPALQRAIQDDDDRLIMAVFDPELFGSGLGLTTEQRERIDLARRRLAWLGAVRSAVRERRVADLARLFVAPVPGGVELLARGERRRVRRLIQQKQALDEFNTAIKGTDDAAIVAALNKVERVKARISDRFAWGVIQRVVERVSIIDELIELAEADTPDYGRLAELIPAARALGLAHDPRLSGTVTLDSLEQRVIRLAHVRRLRAALSRGDDTAIMIAAVPDPHDALDLLNEGERDRVASAILARRRVDRSAVEARFE